MKNPGLRLAIVVVFLYSIFAGFVFTILVDEASYPGAEKIHATGERVNLHGDSFPEIVSQLAETADATILREVRDLQDPKIRHAYLATTTKESPEASWLTDGFPSFSKSVTTIVHPAVDLAGVDPRGNYYVFGSSTAVESVAQGLERLGLGTELEREGLSATAAISWFLGGSIGSATFVTALLVAMLVSISVINNVKSYSIQKLCGIAKLGSIKGDFRRAARFTTVVLTSGAAVGTIALFFYNGLNQSARMITTVGIMFILGIIFIAAVHFLAVSLIWSTNIISGIKGRLGFQVALPIAYLIRIPGLILAISLVTASFAAAQTTVASAQAQNTLQTAGHAATILFEGTQSVEEQDRLAASSGKWLKQEDQANRLLVAIPIVQEDSSGTTTNALIVNNSYIQKHQILSANGAKVSPASKDGVKILVPAGTEISKDDIPNLLGLGGSFDSSVPGNESVESIRPGQEHFLYDPSPDGSNRPISMSNVPVVVFGPEADLISDDDFMAFASQGRILVKDYTTAVQHTPKKFLGSWIAAYIPVLQPAADEHATQVLELRIKLASGIVALVVLITTAIGLAQIHVRGNAQSILVRYLHGWNFFAVHKSIFLSELALTGIAVIWIISSTAFNYFSLTSDKSGGKVHGAEAALFAWQPWTLILVVLINLSVMVVAVALRSHSMVRTRSEETA